MNKSSIKIRPASIEDAERSAALFMRVWHISLKDMVPNGFLNRFQHEEQKKKYVQRADDPEWIFFVAESKGAIVGMVAARDNHVQPLRYQKEIRAMYVDPDYQRQGIGTLLFDSVLSELKKQRARNVMLWCIKANNKAGSFYEKHGGKRIEIIDAPEEYSAMPHVIYTWEFSY